MLTVLITTSGTGSRLGDLTNYTNKSLVPIGDKYCISHIIDLYPNNTEFVITLGYFGNLVKDFLELAYPDKSFKFIDVNPYKGVGSSLGFSMLQASKYLQKPFIFHACDTIIKDKDFNINLDNNWIAGTISNLESNQYRTFNVSDNKVIKINEKDENKYDYIYIGLAGIKDYEMFWKILKNLHNSDYFKTSLSDCHVLMEILKSKKIYTKVINKWYDIGNMTTLKNARDNINREFHVLDKIDESICFVSGTVIKFFSNQKICQNRVKRFELLGDSVPKLLGYKDNFYKSEFIEGQLLSTYNNNTFLKELLEWSDINLWKKKEKPENFYDVAKRFYFDKTKKRLEMLFKKTGINSKEDNINNVIIPDVYELLRKIPSDYLCNIDAYNFHGDFILDNIIKTDNGFKLLDWRQDFGGLIDVGDIYYDLAKLYHNIHFNHANIVKNLFHIETKNEKVTVDLCCNFNLISQLNDFETFIKEKNLDFNKVKLLAAIIWINMAPLHEHPLDLFLYYFGKLNLYRALN